MTGEPVAVTAVDGCGAPLLLDVAGRASRARSGGWPWRGRVRAPTTRQRPGSPTRSATHPAYVSGTTRDERALLTAVPGAIGKAGAECCYAVALPDGRAFALKTDDGAPRVRPVLMAEALRRSGVLDEPGVDADAVRRTGARRAARRRASRRRDPGVLLGASSR